MGDRSAAVGHAINQDFRRLVYLKMINKAIFFVHDVYIVGILFQDSMGLILFNLSSFYSLKAGK